MIHQKTGNSTGNTVPAGFVPRQNTSNSANIVRKATLSLFLFFIMCASYAQNISIVSPTGAYYCGSVVVLETDLVPSPSNPIFWTSFSGGVTLRPIGGTGNGINSQSSISSNRVEAIINGAGSVTLLQLGNPAVTINLTPSPANLNSLSYSSSTTINQPNGIQTTKGWICVKNNSTTETITVSNPSPLNIFWVVSGGAVKVSETQAIAANGDYTYTVTVATSGPTAGKGSIRAFVSDPCGTLTCDPALDWEILKDLMPSEIAGPTCLRDNNLDASGTVVYSITDEFAGNAVYEWELLQNNVPVDPTRTDFKIRSQVLYGNSATIEYNGVAPSDIGNFSLKITNSCSSIAFIRDITVSPATPNITTTTYCISNAIGTVYSVTLPTLLTGQKYEATAQGSVNWSTPVVGNILTVTFADAISGAVEIKVVNETDPTCGSATKLIYFNREGTGAATITGQACIQRGSTDAVVFTANPFGQYNWSISPALPSGYLTSYVGNVLSITPPTGGVDISGNYTVTATLQGCSSTQTASFDFQFGPEQPTITGETCVTPGTSYSYTVTSQGGLFAIATVTTVSNGTVVSPPFPVGTPFSYTAINENATVSITTLSATGCESLPTQIDIIAKPIVTAINATNSCVSFNETPTVTYTAVSTGTTTGFVWTIPTGWTLIPDASATDNVITVTLDNTTAGDIGVTPQNGTCIGDAFDLNVSRNALAVNVSRFFYNASGSVGFLTVESINGTPLHMEVRYSSSELTASGCGGENYPTLSTFASPRTIETNMIYLLDNPNYEWTSIKLTDPATGCTRCIHFRTNSINSGAGNNLKVKNGGIKANLNINTYPNPVENVLNVKVPSKLEVQMMNLFDPQGKIVFSTKEAKNEQKIDVSKFAKGSYILLVVTDKGAETKKIIIE